METDSNEALRKSYTGDNLCVRIEAGFPSVCRVVKKQFQLAKLVNA